jgi:hypothetical protein
MTLKIDYGTYTVLLQHKVPLDGDYTEWYNREKWCQQHFKKETYYYYSHESAWYFKRERDAVFFSLRWA